MIILRILGVICGILLLALYIFVIVSIIAALFFRVNLFKKTYRFIKRYIDLRINIKQETEIKEKYSLMTQSDFKFDEEPLKEWAESEKAHIGNMFQDMHNELFNGTIDITLKDFDLQTKKYLDSNYYEFCKYVVELKEDFCNRYAYIVYKKHSSYIDKYINELKSIAKDEIRQDTLKKRQEYMIAPLVYSSEYLKLLDKKMYKYECEIRNFIYNNIDSYRYEADKELLNRTKMQIADRLSFYGENVEYFSDKLSDEEKFELDKLMKDKNKDIISIDCKSQSRLEIEDIDYMDGHDFEYEFADILEKNGYEDVEVTKGSGDYGIDVTANKDGLKWGFQCKRYQDKVGISAVQEAASGKDYYKCDIAVVVTNNDFTPNAQNLANQLNVKLWNRDVLKKYINQANNL